MKRILCIVTGLSLILAAFIISLSHLLSFPEQRKPLESPLQDRIGLHRGEEIIYHDQEDMVIAGNTTLTVQNRRTGSLCRIETGRNKIESVERICRKPTGNVSVAAAVADGLRIVGDEEIHIVETKPTVKVLISYPNPRSTEDKIIINKSRNMLYFYRGGELIRYYRAATGKQPEFTPEGSFKIANKVAYPDGNNPDFRYGVRWMGLAIPCEKDKRRTNDVRAPNGYKYGIHGTNEPDSIGTYASGGCIRLKNEDVIELYDLAQIGTPVEITW
ncbi:MAG: L,D-transpeptidase [Desulforudis sp.]|jgi:lipoprotein-anchoring transpeptidase ErfK/SrfK|nr:MAG: L,D-transpeptidase [Desulforudis sp.]